MTSINGDAIPISAAHSAQAGPAYSVKQPSNGKVRAATGTQIRTVAMVHRTSGKGKAIPREKAKPLPESLAASSLVRRALNCGKPVYLSDAVLSHLSATAWATGMSGIAFRSGGSVELPHGGSDTTVDSSNANQIVRQWQKLHKVDGPPTRIEAMGHGKPSSAGEADRLGKAGKFMLAVGIPRRITSQFFGV